MFGETLKKSRENTGLDLHEVARTLRIQHEYLKALEDGNLEKLPPEVYVRAYIREYARFLHIEAGPLLDEYVTLNQGKREESPPSPPRVKKKKTIPVVTFLFSLVIVVAVYLGYFLSREEKAPVPAMPSASDRAEPTSPGAESQHAPVARAGPSESNPTEPVKPMPASQHTLEVSATETTWLRVERDEGTSEEVLMKPGESRKWTSQNGFDLKIGNAGGVRLALDNKDMGVPGEEGHVIRLKVPEEGR